MSDSGIIAGKCINIYIEKVKIMNKFEYLKDFQGFFEVKLKAEIKDSYALSLVYTPGVGKSCLEIKDNVQKSFEYTNRANSIAVIAAGDIKNIPVAEYKAALYREFAGIDAYPIVIDDISEDKIAKIIENLAPNFSGFDISSLTAEKANKVVASLSEDFKFPVLTSAIEKTIYDSIPQNNIIDSRLVSVYIFRSVIDTSASKFPDDIAEIVSQALKEHENSNCDLKKELSLAIELAKSSAKMLINAGFARNDRTPEEIESRFLYYLLNGKVPYEKPLKDFISANNDINTNSLELHRKMRGVIETGSKLKLSCFEDLGEGLVKDLSDKIGSAPEQVDYVTSKGNTVAIISDGTAVLGFGNIGAEAGLPVMEGKAALFKSLAGVDAVPLCIKSQDIDDLIEIISSTVSIYGGINLEDIAAPKCFEIEKKLIEKLDIPVFHDDQHGTAVVALAGFINALKLTGKNVDKVKVIINGAGAGALSVSELLLSVGVKNLVLCDTKGAIFDGRVEGMNPYKEEMAKKTNPSKIKGSLNDVMIGADFFFGLSAGNVVTTDMVKSMNTKPVIFALANPVPEIMPDMAKSAGAFIVATGRSDFKNQVNNCLAFPGIFRGVLDIRASRITNEMKINAANAIADLIDDSELNPDYIIPHALDLRVSPEVAYAVAKTARDTGIARRNIDPAAIRERVKNYLYQGI